jgi:TPP-dependent pyruvate/acetoin dehydrogenase alpha subunit
VTVDGMNLFAVNAAASEFVERARQGDGPAYLVCTTYRFHGHHAGDPLNYREKEEVERWRLRDPIERVKQAAIASGAMRPDEIESSGADRATDRGRRRFAGTVLIRRPDQLMTDIYA